MHEINDKYAIKYQYINEDGSFLGSECEQTIPLYCVPSLLKTLAELEARITITSFKKVSE